MDLTPRDATFQIMDKDCSWNTFKAETNVETLEYDVEEYDFNRCKVNIDALKHIIQMLVDKRSKNRRELILIWNLAFFRNPLYFLISLLIRFFICQNATIV